MNKPAGDQKKWREEREPALLRLLTLHEVADRLAVSPRTIRRLVASGELPCLRVGAQLRFDPSDVLRQLQAWKE